jgi:signal transduction histidine kinase
MDRPLVDNQHISTSARFPAPRKHRYGSRISWIAPEPFDAAFSILYLVVLVSFIGSNVLSLDQRAFPWSGTIGMVAAIVSLLTIDRWEYMRYGAMPPAPIAATLLIARMVLIEAVVFIDGFGASPFLYLTLPFTAALAFGSAGGWLVGLVVWIRFALHFSGTTDDWYLQKNAIENLIALPAGVVFVITMARLVVTERTSRLRTEKLLYDLGESHAQLTDYASRVEELAVTDERNRLAREVHDSLGHYLTAINVQLRKASAFRDKDPKQADQAVEDSKRLAHEALEDVRRSVGILRASGQPFALSRALRELITPLQTDKLSITLQIDGSEEQFARTALMALYRAAQEGLTNVQRHAQARRADLTVRFADDYAILTVTDNGVGFDTEKLNELPVGRSGSYGLQGVRERMELVGGTAQVTSTKNVGTTLTLTAPKNPLERRGRMLDKQPEKHEHTSKSALWGCECLSSNPLPLHKESGAHE